MLILRLGLKEYVGLEKEKEGESKMAARLSKHEREGEIMYQKSFLYCFSCIAWIAMTSFVMAQPTGPGGLVPPNNDEILIDRKLILRDGPQINDRRLSFFPNGDIRGFDNDKSVLFFDQSGRNLWLGGHSRAGDLVLLPRNATRQTLEQASVHLNGANGTQRLGGASTNGQLVLVDKNDRQLISLEAEKARLILGQDGEAGDVLVRDGSGKPRISLNGKTGQVLAGQISSKHAGSATSGIKSASVFLSSKNPSIGILDISNGNNAGWYIQAGSTGGLSFHHGTNDLVENQSRFKLSADGSVCIGAC